MDKFVPRSIFGLVTGFYNPPASKVLVGHNASGKQMAHYPEFDTPQVREYWADYQRFGTVKCTGTLEEFFRQRKEQHDGHS